MRFQLARRTRSNCAHASVCLMAMLAVLVSGGCVDHPPYPSSWSPISPSLGPNCSGLSGTFRAQRIGTDVAPWDLAQELDRIVDESGANLSRFDFHRVTDVRLDVAAPRATAVLLAGTERIGTIELGAPQYSPTCDGRALKLLWLEVGAAPFAAGVGHETTMLFRAEDGSLVMRTGSGAVGVVLLVPIGDSYYSWARYSARP